LPQFSDQRPTGDESAESPANTGGNVSAASLKAMLADVPEMTLFADVKMPLWRIVDKTDGE